jgi:hypothetical protein
MKNLMSRVLLIAFLLHLGACSGLSNLPKLQIPGSQNSSNTSSSPNPNPAIIDTIYYKDGRLVNVVRCEGASWLTCFSEAGKICHDSGYDILEKNLSKQPSLFFGDKDIKELYFVCKEIVQDPPVK